MADSAETIVESRYVAPPFGMNWNIPQMFNDQDTLYRGPVPSTKYPVPVKRGDLDGRGDFDGLIKRIFSIPNLCSQLPQLSFIYPSVSI